MQLFLLLFFSVQMWNNVFGSQASVEQCASSSTVWQQNLCLRLLLVSFVCSSTAPFMAKARNKLWIYASLVAASNVSTLLALQEGISPRPGPWSSAHGEAVQPSLIQVPLRVWSWISCCWTKNRFKLFGFCLKPLLIFLRATEWSLNPLPNKFCISWWPLSSLHD